MTEEMIMTVLKTDLGINATAYDSYLSSLISSAMAAIQKEGITLQIIGKQPDDDGAESDGITYTTEDGMLIEAYAAYLYRKRREEVAAMPRYLRYMLNNRLFSEKGEKR